MTTYCENMMQSFSFCTFMSQVTKSLHAALKIHRIYFLFFPKYLKAIPVFLAQIQKLLL